MGNGVVSIIARILGLTSAPLLFQLCLTTAGVAVGLALMNQLAALMPTRNGSINAMWKNATRREIKECKVIAKKFNDELDRRRLVRYINTILVNFLCPPVVVRCYSINAN